MALSFRLTNLIRFYEGTVSSVVRGECGLTQTLADLHRLSYSQFMSMLQVSGGSSDTKVLGLGSDLNQN